MNNNYFNKYNNKTLINTLIKLNKIVDKHWYKEICNSMERDTLIFNLKKELNTPFNKLKSNILEELTTEDIFTNSYLNNGEVLIVENEYEVLFKMENEDIKKYILNHLILHLELLSFCEASDILQFIKIYNLNQNEISFSLVID